MHVTSDVGCMKRMSTEQTEGQTKSDIRQLFETCLLVIYF